MNKQLTLLNINRWVWRFLTKHAGVRKRLTKYTHKLTAPPGDGVVCLPDRRLLQVNEEVLTQENMVLPVQVIDHFIERSGYRAIMNFCLCRDANTCKNYPIDLGCIFLGEAAKGIHPDIHRSATKEEAKAHVQRLSQAGLVYIAGKVSFDATLLGVGPDDKLLLICGCCPCCCIARALPFIPRELSDTYQRMPGVSVQIKDTCIGCGECVEACIFEGVKLDGKRENITDSCRACGRCARVCPSDSIKISVTDDTFVQQTIDLLSKHVDVT